MYWNGHCWAFLSRFAARASEFIFSDEYAYCVYPAISKIRNKRRSHSCNGVLYEVHAHTFTVCYCRLGWISKAIYRSVTIHRKNEYDKCHLWYIYYVTVNQVMTTTVNFRSDDFILTKRNTWFSNVLAILYHGNHDSTQRLYVLIVETLY